MSAFSTATLTMFRDRNMAVDATWLAEGLSPGQPVRVIISQPDLRGAWNQVAITSATTMVQIQASQVAEPAAGDLVVVGGVTYCVQGEPERDVHREVWTAEVVEVLPT